MESIKIKDNWGEVTIREWVEIGKLGQMEELKDLNIATRIKVAAILSNKTEEEIGEMSGQMWADIYGAVEFVNTPPKKKRKQKGCPHRIIKLNKTEYIFHPNPQQMNAGEQASVEQMLVDSKNGGEPATAGILAILVRPLVRVRNEEFDREDFEIEKFDTKNFDERRELFLDHLTVDEVWHEWAFFFNLGKKLSAHSLKSGHLPQSRQMRRKQNREKDKK